MLASVELDTESRATARQVDNERWYDQLPRKRRTIAGDAVPNGQFGGRGIVAQFSRTAGELGIDAMAHGASVGRRAPHANPPPAPSLQGGEQSWLKRPP